MIPAESAAAAPRLAALARVALPVVLVLAGALRLWGATRDLPFSFYGDELHLVKRAMAMGTGDLNPHWFHKPALLMYVLLGCYGLFFAGGRVVGRFESAEQFGAYFLTDPGAFLLLGRLLVAASGVVTVYLVYRIGWQVFRERAPALVAALAAAVIPAMVSSAQEIKEDAPAAMFMALAVFLFLGGRAGANSRRSRIWAPLAAGAATGTKFYGIVLLPAFVVAEFARDGAQRFRRAWRRGLVAGLLLLAGFFAVSPFHLLDPTFGRALWVQLRGSGLVASDELAYEPDLQTLYQPGPRAWLGSTGKLLRRAASGEALGGILAVLALAGVAAALRERATRVYGSLVLAAALSYAVIAAVAFTYHVQPRHLNAILPLLCPLLWPGAVASGRALRLPAALLRPAAAVLLAAGIGLALARSLAATHATTRLDSRSVAYRWIVGNLPRDQRLLLEDYGPPLQPNRAAVRRQLRLLAELPKGPFTWHQRRRLELLERYPSADGFDLEELGHQWWLPEEKTDQQLRGDLRDQDMGNPLVQRVPRPLAAYRAEGIRYVVTNSAARNFFMNKPSVAAGFPSFVRYYRELEGTRLLRAFDPRDWGGKGPVVWIYDLGVDGAR